MLWALVTGESRARVLEDWEQGRDSISIAVDESVGAAFWGGSRLRTDCRASCIGQRKVSRGFQPTAGHTARSRLRGSTGPPGETDGGHSDSGDFDFEFFPNLKIQKSRSLGVLRHRI